MEPLDYLLAFVLAVTPALFWLTIFYKKDYRDPEPKKIIFYTFLSGALAALPFLGLRFILTYFSITNPIITGGASIFIFAALEELAKLAAAVFVVSKHKTNFNKLIDGAIYAIAAALGFAFIENIIYFTNFLESATTGLLYVVAFRSLGSMLGHVIFSGLAGLLWAYAYFSKQITNKKTKHILAFTIKDFINKEILTLHIIRRNILMAHPSRRGGHEEKILVLEGLVLATFLHSLFNIIIDFNIFDQELTFLAVPGLMAGFLLISNQFALKFNQKMFKVV